jgi:hypothetical protein
MKKLALGLMLCLAFNVAQAAPHQGGHALQNIFERIQTKLAEIKSNIGHNIKHGGHGNGGGSGACH